jgi:predicted dinucleotide-binding enzyme
VPAEFVADALAPFSWLSGVPVIDATNAYRNPPPSGFDTQADYVASLVPAAPVAKAFNTVGAEFLGSGRIDGRSLVMPIAGDIEARAMAGSLASAVGFEVADLGGREAFGLVEAFGKAWIHLAMVEGWGREFGFGILRPSR